MLRPPIRALPSVIVDTEKVLREAEVPVEKWLHEESASGEKVIAPGCASKAGRVSRWGARRSQAEARSKGAKVHFASPVDVCHLKNAELEAKHQKQKGRVVLRDDIVKDDSGSFAVFTEQGSSASQMTASKVMDIISRLPGCAGQTAEAVSAYTQVNMEDASKLLKIPKSECPDNWIRLPRHKWLTSWSSMEDPVVPLERNLYGHPLAGLLCERQFEKILFEVRFGQGFQLGMLIPTPWKRVILICVCGWLRIGWKETKHWSDVECTQQRSWFGRTNLFLRSCVLGMFSKTTWNKQRYCWQ